MTDYTETCTAYVRGRGRAWRDADIEVVSISASGCMDRTMCTQNGVKVSKPASGLVIDGADYCRFKLADGRIAAVLLTSITQR